MLKNIKSLFFVRIVFSFVEEKQKLKILKYNKSFQKTINISINNYKHFKGKYIIYESDEYGKEYNGYDDNLLYEGEYYNGEKNGIGREYDDEGELIYEGEYLNGKRKNFIKSDNYIIKKINISGNGNGQEYDKEGNLLFDGEYLFGDRNGKGKEYYPNNKLKFEGEYLNGKRNGIGKEYYDNEKIKFEGIYLNNKKWEGKGYDLLHNIVYELKNGKGLIKEYDYYNNQLIFESEFLYGNYNGKAKKYYYYNGI